MNAGLADSRGFFYSFISANPFNQRLSAFHFLDFKQLLSLL